TRLMPRSVYRHWPSVVADCRGEERKRAIVWCPRLQIFERDALEEAPLLGGPDIAEQGQDFGDVTSSRARTQEALSLKSGVELADVVKGSEDAQARDVHLAQQ